MATSQQLDGAARKLAATLKQRSLRIVFAESCTAGLVSAVVAKTPGISEYLCGSAVVYRIDTKHRWLGIDAGILKKPGPVSRVVAAAMAEQVLAKTPEADLAASITGHLGPDAPDHQDGLIYVGISMRGNGHKPPTTKVVKHRLPTTQTASPSQAATTRTSRQRAAARFVLQRATSHIDDT